MYKLSLAVLAIAIATTFAVAGLAGNDNDAQALSQIHGYQQWTKVNDDPVKVEALKTTDLIALGLAETPV